MPLRNTGTAEVQLHSCLTSALDGGKQSTSCHGCFTDVQRPCYPLNRRLGEPQGHFGEDKNPLPMPEMEPCITQPIA